MVDGRDAETTAIPKQRYRCWPRRTKARRLVFIVMLAGLLLLAISSATAWAGLPSDWTTTKITDDTLEQQWVAVSGNRLAWYGWDGHDYEIFTWAVGDSAPTQLSSTSWNCYHPEVYGDRVVWQGYDGSDWEIYTWKLGDSSPTQLTDNIYSDTYPSIDGDRVAWLGHDGSDNEIFTWKVGDSSPTQITNNAYYDSIPIISGTRLAWNATPTGTDYEIFTWKLGDSSPTQITDNIYNDVYFDVSGDRIVWYALDGTDNEIYTWKSGDSSPSQITDNDYGDGYPQISGSRVVWVGNDGSDNEIFMWTEGDSSPTQLTDNAYSDTYPQIDGTRVVWTCNDGDDEICTWKVGDGSPTQLTDNAYPDTSPRSSGDRVVWIGQDDADTEVFTSAILPVTRFQQTDPKITYLGDWSSAGTWSASGGSFAYTGQPGAAAVARFSGTEVSVVALTSPWYGEANIYLDGSLVDTVDLYSASTAWKVPIYTNAALSFGEHTIIIECTGDKNVSSGGTYVALDALDITGYIHQATAPTRIDDKDATCTVYNPAWVRWDNSGYWAAFMDTYAITDQETYRMTMAFEGTHLSWVSRTSNTQGKAKVTLDGNDAEAVIVDLYSPSVMWKKRVYSTGILDDTTHYVTIECLREKNPASWWYTVGVDAFDIVGTPATPPALPPGLTRYQQTDSWITYLGGGWSTVSNGSASGGSYATTSQKGAAALAQFTGTGVAILAATGPAYGEANIYLDGSFVGNLDLYSPTPAWKVSIYADTTLASGGHTVAIQCTGYKNASSSSTAINIDALEIIGSLDQADTPDRIDDNDPIAVYDSTGWVRWDYSGYWAASGDTYAITSETDTEVTITFQGTHFSWVSRTSNTQGKAEVTLDGNTAGAQVIDLYSPSVLWKQRVYSTGIMADTTHYVTIKCLGEKNQASWWFTVGVDAFDILVTDP